MNPPWRLRVPDDYYRAEWWHPRHYHPFVTMWARSIGLLSMLYGIGIGAIVVQAHATIGAVLLGAGALGGVAFVWAGRAYQ